MKLKIFFLLAIIPLIGAAQDSLSVPTPFDEGYFFVGKDDVLKFKGYAQADAYFPYENDSVTSEFRMRRVRFAATGFFQKNFRYMLYARFDGGKAELNEAFLESRHLSFAKIRIGQFKVPFSLYNLTSSSQLYFMNRPLVVDNFSPGYDIGGMLFGEVFKAKIDYAIGVFNGKGRNEIEKNSNKDIIARLVLIPFKDKKNNVFKHLYLGSSYDWGTHTRPFQNKRYETGTGIPFLIVNDESVTAVKTRKYGADLEYLLGNFILRAEKLWIKDRIGNRAFQLNNSGYVADISYVLNAKKLNKNSRITPEKELDPSNGFWGAFQVSLRYQELNLDDSYRFLKDVQGVGEISSFAGGINWFPNDDVKIALNYETYSTSSRYPENFENEPSDLIALRVQYQF